MTNLVEQAKAQPDVKTNLLDADTRTLIVLTKDMANEIEALQANQVELLAAMRNISVLSAAGPHMSARDGLAAALKALGHARDIARTAIANARKDTS